MYNSLVIGLVVIGVGRGVKCILCLCTVVQYKVDSPEVSKLGVYPDNNNNNESSV